MKPVKDEAGTHCAAIDRTRVAGSTPPLIFMYQGSCECGWQSRERRKASEAGADIGEHLAQFAWGEGDEARFAR